MRGELLPCDWADVVNQKLYAQGIGWTRIGARKPCNIAIAALFHIGYNETNMQHHFRLHLETEDGAPYPTEAPFFVEGAIEVGRPPGMSHGEESVAPFSAIVSQATFEPGGYLWKLTVAEELLAVFPFRSA